jgi:hypothetical protein
MVYPGVYYCVRAPISGMADLLCRKARRAIILALEEYKPAYNIALRIASCLDLSQIQGDQAYFVSNMPRQNHCHTSLSNLSQELWIDAAVTLTGSYRSRCRCAVPASSLLRFIGCVHRRSLEFPESRVITKLSLQRHLPSTMKVFTPAFLLASGLSLHIP